MSANLYENLGLLQNPFSKRSSEQEVKFINDIFYEPNYYNTLINDLISGDSRFIIGQRGHGKTSIINKLYEDLELKEKLFVIKVDRYDSIPIKDNECDFIFLIIQELIKKQAINLLKNKVLIKKLTKEERETLATFIQVFFKPISKIEFEATYNKIRNIKRRNIVIKLYNLFCVGLFNNLTSTAINITSNIIRQSIGFDSINTENICREYFSKINPINIERQETQVNDVTKKELKDVLYKLCEIYNKLGFEKIIVLFDKIDECQKLYQDVVKTSNFTKEILSDTELLLNDNISIGFSLWSELKSELSGSVRFDKFGTIDVRWGEKDMIPLMNKRLKYYSNNKNKPIEFYDLVKNEIDQNEIVTLANKSPRDFIILLAEIFQEQSNRKSHVNTFDNESIRNGMVNFCKNYDYDSITPSKQGRSKEIRSMINRLLILKLPRFTHKDLNSSLKQKDKQSMGQIKLMINYHLIREEEFPDDNGIKIYEVIDPKVKFMIKHLIERIE